MTDVVNGDLVEVVVAPGASVRVAPHPSGYPSLAPLWLGPGEKLAVTEERAEQLYRGRQILHPQTGQVKPTMRSFVGVTVSRGNGPIEPTDEHRVVRVGEQAAEETRLLQELADAAYEERNAMMASEPAGRGRVQISSRSEEVILTPGLRLHDAPEDWR